MALEVGLGCNKILCLPNLKYPCNACNLMSYINLNCNCLWQVENN